MLAELVENCKVGGALAKGANGDTRTLLYVGGV